MQISALLPNRIDAKISLQPHSRFIGVTGPSGAGKSSLFRALAGVEKSAKVQTPWADKKVGIVFQQPMLFPHTDVRGNLALAQRHASSNALSIEESLRGCCSEHLIDKPVQALSGGEAQRIAIARALVNGPNVLLLDESLSAIDIFTRRKIYQFLNNLCVTGQLTCFVISHDLDDLALFSDELIYIDKGHVELCGKTRDVLATAYEKDGLATPSSVLEGVKLVLPRKALDSNQSQNAAIGSKNGSDAQQSQNIPPLQGNEQCQTENGIERVEVARQEIYVTTESLSYLPQQSDGQTPVRFAVKSCDVSIDTNFTEFGTASTSSILNALPCVISSIEYVSFPLTSSEGAANITQTERDTTKSAKVLLTLNVLDSTQNLYASISYISLKRLKLVKGMQVIARFKLP
ncbi:ATP-binding cassette domain-containing protein [Alteromonas sp. BL110]|uniref:ATP-binding cassette domain-containing protein n=1 Tax=Alteromonas sp. BL110 TaxID=1714845 RepID=UPI000E4C0B9D|nr:ATP-binding cassette domain-containing protein [Alteromonas sp. BL110]AXT40080.1 ATP-binding cassette domain-containing protein [Alteromonas sp. BL110]RKM79311.1 ATP-binding cassette domain-containing protein [Alteromonas sp. BL110]